MPWVRRSHHGNNGRLYWVVAGIASVIVGILAGYSWWGDTASMVDVVERQLGESQAQIRRLEKRIHVLETKVGVAEEGDEAASAPTVKAY
jgi:hypothetical protein